MITIEQVARETVPAWVECPNCNDESKSYYLGTSCPNCEGDGGEWHPSVYRTDNYDTAGPNGSSWDAVGGIKVTKTSTLTRTHEVCRECGWNKECKWRLNLLSYRSRLGCCNPDKCVHKNSRGDCNNKWDCPHCLKDSEGKPTGAEPNTASDWSVK